MITLDIIQNDPEVPLGNYALFLEEKGIACRTVRPYAGDVLPGVEEVEGAIVLGGAMGVYDTLKYPYLDDVKRFLAEVVAAKKPVLGICLGGQLLADVLGAKITCNSPARERGTLPVSLSEKGLSDPLFAGVPRQFISFQWHNDSFAIPEGADLLASSPVCAGQAFRYGKAAYGTQFHPEVTPQIVTNWSGNTAERAKSTARYLAEFTAREMEYEAASRLILQNFLSIVLN